MKLIPYETSALENLMVGERKSDNFKMLSEFIDSGLKCALVEGWPHVSANSARNSLRTSARRYRMTNQVIVITRNGKVFLVKKELA